MVQLAAGFVPSGFFVLRTPLLPFDEVLAWSDGTLASTTRTRRPGIAETDDHDRLRLRLHVNELLARREVHEALFVASPDLVNAIDHWRQAPDSKRGRRVETSLVRYFLRMTGRPTPFGLFAGYSLGRVDSKTRLVIEGRSTYQRHTRLDMQYLCGVVEVLERDAKLRQMFIHRPNSSLYRAACRVRYVEARTSKNARLYRLVALDADNLLDLALALAKDGIYPYQLAVALAKKETNLSLSEAEEFVNELIENQVIVSELAPVITGDDPVVRLLSKLALHEEVAEVTNHLRRCVTRLRELDKNDLRNGPTDYQAVVDDLAALMPDFDHRRPLQIDLVKPAPQATLGTDVISEITKGIEILRRSSDMPRQDLSYFCAMFHERYGPGREVPLLEALDPDIGIGFALSSAAVPDGPRLRSQAEPQSRFWSARDTHLLSLIQRALVDESGQVTLDEDDLDALRVKTPLPLPDAFAVSASIAAASENDLAQGRFRVNIRKVQGPSGVRLLGRFCLYDDELLRRTKEHILAEEALRPDAVFAEIVHLPAGRTGNVLLRPRLRNYEIPYLGASGSPLPEQIPVIDLCVTVIDQRVILRSIRLGREVIPRLTAAHYYTFGGLDVYRFLCLLQDHGYASELEWDWGLAVHSSFLPRVCFQRLLLSRSRWNLTARELHRLNKVSRPEGVNVIQEWRTKKKWPRRVAVVDDENELPVDLDNVLCNETLAEIIKRRDRAQLVEVFPSHDELCVRGPEGRFAHEIIVPFVRARPPAPAVLSSNGVSAPHVKRTFAPGSEWLYLKLYTGKSTADQVLRQFVRPAVDEAQRSGSSDQWFFIRYGDPFWHIRLRFHGERERLHTILLPSLNATVDRFISAGVIWRVQIDTYEREVERYGGTAGIVLAERIFQADSEAVLTMIEDLSGNQGLEARRLLALRSIDRLLDDFGLELRVRSRLIDALCGKSAGPLAANRRSGNPFGNLHRNMRLSIGGVLEGTPDMQAAFGRQFAALDRRSKQMESAIAELRTYAETNQLSVSLARLISSFVHLHTNRILRPTQGNEELLLYHLLARFYRSRIARQQ